MDNKNYGIYDSYDKTGFENHCYEGLESNTVGRTKDTRTEGLDNPQYVKKSTMYKIIGVLVVAFAIIFAGSLNLVYSKAENKCQCQPIQTDRDTVCGQQTKPSSGVTDGSQTTTRSLEEGTVKTTTAATTKKAPMTNTKLVTTPRTTTTKTLMTTTRSTTTPRTTTTTTTTTLPITTTATTTSTTTLPLTTTSTTTLPTTTSTTMTTVTNPKTTTSTWITTRNGPDCASSWPYQYSSSCYRFELEAVEWTSAKSACRSYGGYLVEIKDTEEQNFLASTATIISVKNKRFWIGLTDLIREGTFVWDHSNETLTSGSYRNWAVSQPDNGSGTEDCTHLFENTFYWNDDQCYNRHYFICEKDG